MKNNNNERPDLPPRGRGGDNRSDNNRTSEKDPRINGQIRASEIRLVGDDGHQYGVVSINEAFRISDEKGLDLVEVSPTAKPPVVKLIDFGKFKYEKQKKASEAKKKQVVIMLKEIQFRPNIEKHDQEVKLKKIEEILQNGDKVKLIMQFRGREMANKSIGLEKFDQILKNAEEMGGIIESPAKFMGNRVIAILASTAKKKPKEKNKPEASS